MLKPTNILKKNEINETFREYRIKIKIYQTFTPKSSLQKRTAQNYPKTFS